MATIRSRTALAPRSWNVSLGSVTDSGVRSPADLTTAFAVGVERQCRDERHAAGQGHDLRPRSHSEERADLRGDHPPGPGRVAVYIPVNA